MTWFDEWFEDDGSPRERQVAASPENDAPVVPMTVGEAIEALKIYDPNEPLMVAMSSGYALHVDVFEMLREPHVVVIRLSHEGMTL